MSLINEALKKAQRQRHDANAGPGAPGADASGTIAKRAQPKSARSMLLLAVGAIALVVASMVGTALWLTRPSNPPAVARTTPSPSKVDAKSQPGPEVKPMITVPTTPVAAPAKAQSKDTAPATDAASGQAGTAIAASPSSSRPAQVAQATPAPTPAKAVAASPVEEQPLPAKTEPPPPAAKPDERVHQFVESLKVMGIRSSGADSKVLMNDRVYRVNDIVDRGLGVRLTKVSADSLTFTDANGVTYVKYF